MAIDEKSLDELLEEDEKLGAEMSVAQKRAAIAEAKARYGDKDWKRVVGKGMGQLMGGLKGNIHEPPTLMRPK